MTTNLLKLAEAYDEAVSEYDALMRELGIISDKSQSHQTQTLQVPVGYKRVTQTPGRELQNISQQILNKYRGKPFGFSVPFSYDGVNYLGVIEEHFGGAVPGKHPGVSLFVQIADRPNTNRLSGLNEKIKPLAEQLIELAAKNGIQLAVTSGYRSNEEQQGLYQQGRTTKGPIVTQVGPGKSKHNYGLAFDVATLNDKGQPYWPEDNELWDRIGALGESLGLRWGGRWKGFKDRPHFEI